MSHEWRLHSMIVGFHPTANASNHPIFTGTSSTPWRLNMRFFAEMQRKIFLGERTITVARIVTIKRVAARGAGKRNSDQYFCGQFCRIRFQK